MTAPKPQAAEIETLPLPPAYAKRSLSTDQDLWESREDDEDSEDGEIPFGRICLTVCMLFVGVAVMVYGVVEEVKSPMPAKGVPFWIIGVLILIPACYCTYELTTLWRRARGPDSQQGVEESPF